MQKTITEYLAELPEEIRDLAIMNLHPSQATAMVHSPAQALLWAFEWSDTLEGGEFWWNAYCDLQGVPVGKY
jgi:hypothetical protein